MLGAISSGYFYNFLGDYRGFIAVHGIFFGIHQCVMRQAEQICMERPFAYPSSPGDAADH